ncbi:hypothetical protein [Actinophytocola glycyrrhizae]|uniref:ABC-2 type transport system permease protein n=1 Tax=Actinophytocola glycyrrhizae TaxID=2044873 RepID=A0ABV9S2L4_9PSEU
MTARLPLLRVLLTAHVSFGFVLWLPLMLLSALIVTGIGIWGEVDRSIWHYLATQAPRWFALGVGVDAINTYLRLNLAHGRTRRDFLRQLWSYLPGLAVCLAVLVTAGYQLERGAYALLGWDHRLAYPSVFGDTGNVLGILGSFSVVLLLWATAGVLIAAGFTRGRLLGIATVPFGLVLVAPGEVLTGFNGSTLLELVTLTSPVLPTVAICLGLAVLACAATWGIVRDIPLRAKVA